MGYYSKSTQESLMSPKKERSIIKGIGCIAIGFFANLISFSLQVANLWLENKLVSVIITLVSLIIVIAGWLFTLGAGYYLPGYNEFTKRNKVWIVLSVVISIIDYVGAALLISVGVVHFVGGNYWSVFETLASAMIIAFVEALIDGLGG